MQNNFKIVGMAGALMQGIEDATKSTKAPVDHPRLVEYLNILKTLADGDPLDWPRPVASLIDIKMRDWPSIVRELIDSGSPAAGNLLQSGMRELRGYCDAWDKGESVEVVTEPATAKTPRKKRSRQKRNRQPTKKQIEAMHIVGECNRNFREAGRRLNLDPKTVKQHYDAGLKNAGRLASKFQGKPKTGPLPSDKRGQSSIATSRFER
jgi:hypothetical protein